METNVTSYFAGLQGTDVSLRIGSSGIVGKLQGVHPFGLLLELSNGKQAFYPWAAVHSLRAWEPDDADNFAAASHIAAARRQ